MHHALDVEIRCRFVACGRRRDSPSCLPITLDHLFTRPISLTTAVSTMLPRANTWCQASIAAVDNRLALLEAIGRSRVNRLRWPVSLPRLSLGGFGHLRRGMVVVGSVWVHCCNGQSASHNAQARMRAHGESGSNRFNDRRWKRREDGRDEQ